MSEWERRASGRMVRMTRHNKLESDIEKKLVEGVRSLGGVAYKWISPGVNGVPDRIVMLPNHVSPYFVELKTESGRLSVRQSVQIRRLRRLGQHVCVLYGEEDVEAFLQDPAVFFGEVEI